MGTHTITSGLCPAAHCNFHSNPWPRQSLSWAVLIHLFSYVHTISSRLLPPTQRFLLSCSCGFSSGKHVFSAHGSAFFARICELLTNDLQENALSLNCDTEHWVLTIPLWTRRQGKPRVLRLKEHKGPRVPSISEDERSKSPPCLCFISGQWKSQDEVTIKQSYNPAFPSKLSIFCLPKIWWKSTARGSTECHCFCLPVWHSQHPWSDQ